MTKLAFILLVPMSIPSCVTDQEILEKELNYVLDVPEVSWMLVKDDKVFIGFKTESDSLMFSVLQTAAPTGNKVINSNVKISAVDHKDKELVLAGKGFFPIQKVLGIGGRVLTRQPG
ncbi:MAG: hypothetical protein O7D34_08530 [Ignavibacteria bacterium]|nr:hypothetical protein [Ignavibacteria bacterium]